MIRIYILLVIVVLILAYFGFPRLKKIKTADINKFAGLIAVLLLVFLTLTGKLTWLFAMLGVAFAFLMRMLPVILRYEALMYRLWASFGYSRNGSGQSENRQRPAVMSKEEALDILGLKPGVGEQDIIAAHRKLISRMHPDKGGSDFLAAQINLAKKVLLDR